MVRHADANVGTGSSGHRVNDFGRVRSGHGSVCVASSSRRDAGFTFRPNDGKNQSLYFINFITK